MTRAEALAAVTEAVRVMYASRRPYDLACIERDAQALLAAGVASSDARDVFRRACDRALADGATLAEVTAAYDAGDARCSCGSPATRCGYWRCE